MKATKRVYTQKSKGNNLADLYRVSFLEEVTEDDIKLAISPIHTIVFAVS